MSEDRGLPKEWSDAFARLFAEDDRFRDSTIDNLKKSPESTSENSEALRVRDAMANEKLRKAQQENTLRDRFFLWAFILASVIIGANFALMGYYAFSLSGRVPAEVMVFWISATVVKILGIIYIIAQYLFPKRRK